MLRPLRLSTPDHKTFFTSDLHVSHAKVAVKRGFDSIEAHDNSLVHSWNATCDADSHVVSLGDIITDDKTGGKLKTFLRRIHFHTLFMQAGNHASGFSAFYKAVLAERFPDAFDAGQLLYEVYPLTTKLDDGPKTLVFLPDYIEIHLNKAIYVCCHYPIVSHNKMGRGSFSLSGHSHSGCHLTNIKTGRGKRLDVGWEGFGRPISASEVKHILESRDIDAWDHHGKDAESS